MRGRRLRVHRWGLAGLLGLAAGCGGGSAPQDAGPDASSADTAPDATTDTALDVALADSADAAFDASTDREAAVDVAAPDTADASVVDAGPGMDLWYVVNQLTVPGSSDVATAMGVPGFDLDERFSQGGTSTMGPGCGKEDYFSTLDLDQNCSAPDLHDQCTAPATTGARVTFDAVNQMQTGGHGGVDNQLPDLAATLSAVSSGANLPGLVTTYVNQSRLVLLVRVSDLHSLTEDPYVRVRVYTGYPTFSAGCSMVQAGRRYQVAASSVVGGDLERAQTDFTGSISAGRLRVRSVGSLTLPLPPFAGLVLSLRLLQPQLRFDLAGTDATRSLGRGNLGGGMPGQDILDAVAANPMLMPYRTLVEGAIGGLVDLMNPVCVQRTGATLTRLGQIGLGVGVTAVAADVDTSGVAAAQAPGTCGAPFSPAG